MGDADLRNIQRQWIKRCLYFGVLHSGVTFNLVHGLEDQVVVGVLCLTVIWHLTYLELSGLKIFSIASPVNYARDLTAIFIISVSVFYLIVQRLNQTLLESRLELRERLRADDKMNTQAQYLAALHDTALGLINRLELSPSLS